MKLKLVSFTNYKLNVDIYEKSDIDFFSYLFLNLVYKKSEHILLDEIRKFMEIPDKLAYMFENSFYNLLENNLIVSKNDEYLTTYLDDIKFTYLGEECYENKILYKFVSTEDKEINISPFDDSIVALKDDVECLDYIVLSKVNDKKKVEDIINKNLKKVFPTYNEIKVVVKDMESDSYIFEYESKNFKELEKYGLKENLRFFDCKYRDVLDDNVLISSKSLNINNIKYDVSEFDFLGSVNGIEYGFYYYVVDDIPYIKMSKIK